jgi:PAS domain S-box-containing protein
VGVGRDITYQIPVAQRLIELWKREHTLVQRSLVGIYVIQDGVFKFVNEALAKIFGYASEELIGKQYIDLVAKDDKEKVKDEVERKIKGEERKPYSFKGIKRDGTEIDVMVDSARIPYEGKDALLGTLRDITEEKRLKENLEEEVKKRTEAFGRFTEDIAHELKTPISTILTIIDNYRRGLIKEDEVPQTLENIFMELERLNLFSEKLWRLIEVESGKCEVRLDSINVYQEINSLWSRLQSKAGQKGILFRVGKEIKNWRPLRTDKDLFGHIVLNLLDNAIKYSFERSYIEVSGKTEPGTVIIDFVSKGKTISPEDQVKIFEKYYRTKEAKDMVPAGSGIGLYLVKKLMELLGGRIEVKSVPVPGATKGESLNIFRLIFII